MVFGILLGSCKKILDNDNHRLVSVNEIGKIREGFGVVNVSNISELARIASHLYSKGSGCVRVVYSGELTDEEKKLLEHVRLNYKNSLLWLIREISAGDDEIFCAQVLGVLQTQFAAIAS